jgi:hypothetical protein
MTPGHYSSGVIILRYTAGYLLPQFLNEEPLILKNVSIDIKNLHVPRILIFNNIGENYRLLNLLIFEQ